MQTEATETSGDFPQITSRTLMNVSETATPYRTSPSINKNNDNLSGWVPEKPRAIETSPVEVLDNAATTPQQTKKLTSNIAKNNSKSSLTLPTRIFKSYIPAMAKETSPLRGHYFKRSDIEKKNPRLAPLRNSKSEIEYLLAHPIENESSSPDPFIETSGVPKPLIDKPKEAIKDFMKLKNNAAFQTIVNSPRGENPAVPQTVDLLLFKPKLKPKHIPDPRPPKRSQTFLDIKKYMSVEPTKPEPRYKLSHPAEKDTSKTLPTESGTLDLNPYMNHALPYKGITHNPKRFFKPVTISGLDYSRKNFFGMSVLNKGHDKLLPNIHGGLDNPVFKSPFMAGETLELTDRTKLIKEYLHKVSQSKLVPAEIDRKIIIPSPSGHKVIERLPNPKSFYIPIASSSDDTSIMDSNNKESRYRIPTDKISNPDPINVSNNSKENSIYKGTRFPRLHGNLSPSTSPWRNDP